MFNKYTISIPVYTIVELYKSTAVHLFTQTLIHVQMQLAFTFRVMCEQIYKMKQRG